MCKLVYQAIGKYIHPTRYRQIIETENAKKLSLEDKNNISVDEKHSSQVARIYYQKNTSRPVAVDGQISMKRLVGGSRDTSDSLIKSMLFSEKSESDISKADLKEIKKTLIVLTRKKMMRNPLFHVLKPALRKRVKRNMKEQRKWMTRIQPHQILVL